MNDEIFYKVIDLLNSMIATPSPSRSECDVANLIEQFLQHEGADVKRIGNNLLVGYESLDNHDGDSRPVILLNSHIDTVRPAAGWTADPFTPQLDESTGRLYGLGSNDAGASAVSLIATYLLLRDTEQPYRLLLLLSAEEEVGGEGGIRSVVPLLDGKIDFAVVGEPTGMRPAIAEKGLMVLDGIVTGVAGHAARNEGVNAIYKAIDVIDRLRRIRFDKESATLGPVKVTVTQIEAGSAHNVIPDECRFVVDVRTTDAYSNVATLDYIRREVPDCTLTPRSTRLNASGLSADHPFVRRAVMMGLEPFGSPTLSDQSLMPWPSVKIGPGDSARSHTADEYILLDEIRQAIEYYTRLLHGLQLP